MSGGSGGPIIIKKRIRDTASTGAVLDELGPRKRAKAEAVLAKQDADWSLRETKFLLNCVIDAVEAYDE
jgi:hypothetical protein